MIIVLELVWGSEKRPDAMCFLSKLLGTPNKFCVTCNTKTALALLCN